MPLLAPCPGHVPLFTLGSFAHNLLQVEDPQAREHLGNWTGPICRIIVLKLRKTQRKPATFLYFGEPQDIHQLDPRAWSWKDGVPLLQYTAKRGRELITAKKELKKTIQHKWRQEYPINFQVDWKDPWRKDRAKKEGGFLWATWHRAVATNTWRAVIAEVVLDCPCCTRHMAETFMHRFYHCPQVQAAWAFAFTIIHRLQRQGTTPIPAFSFEQCIFSRDIRFRQSSVKTIWHLLRGITLWTSWLARNAAVYERQLWPVTLL